jgi:hypothetical protein
VKRTPKAGAAAAAARLVATAGRDVGYDPDKKAAFLRDATIIGRALAAALGLARGEYQVRVNRGGVAVSGEVVLHTTSLYVMFYKAAGDAGRRFLWRTCVGTADYVGGPNQWADWKVLTDLKKFAAVLRTAAEGGAQPGVPPQLQTGSSRPSPRKGLDG